LNLGNTDFKFTPTLTSKIHGISVFDSIEAISKHLKCPDWQGVRIQALRIFQHYLTDELGLSGVKLRKQITYTKRYSKSPWRYYDLYTYIRCPTDRTTESVYIKMTGLDAIGSNFVDWVNRVCSDMVGEAGAKHIES